MAGEQSDLRWLHGLQRKLGVQPSGRQTFEAGFEPVGEIYRCASAELFGTVVLVITTGFAITAAGELPPRAVWLGVWVIWATPTS